MKQEYPNVAIFWVPAISIETFERAYQEIATELGVRLPPRSNENIKRLVQRQLNAKSAGKWLLIINNADDLDLLRGTEHTEGLLDFLPDNDDSLTLFTTRHLNVAQRITGTNVIKVGKMQKDEGFELLKKSMAQEIPHDQDERAGDLLTELDYLPLAISQSAAYMNCNECSLDEYLHLFKTTIQDTALIMSEDFGANSRYKSSENAVAKTWTVTFNHILKHYAYAAKLLQFLSCIEWKGIPYSLFCLIQLAAQRASAIGTLCSYSFL